MMSTTIPDIKLFSESNQEVVISDDEDEFFTQDNPLRAYQEISLNEYIRMDNMKAIKENEDKYDDKVNN